MEGFYSYLLVSEFEFSTLSIRIVVLSEVVEVISSFSLAHLTRADSIAEVRTNNYGSNERKI